MIRQQLRRLLLDSKAILKDPTLWVFASRLKYADGRHLCKPDQPKSDLEAVCGSRSVRARVGGHQTFHDQTDNSFPTSFTSIFSYYYTLHIFSNFLVVTYILTCKYAVNTMQFCF